MSYESAPATRMLATHCAICRRPLLDARSVEIGIGPDCRKRHGYDDAQVPEEAREVANQRICAIARTPDDSALVASTIAELELLGFKKLCETLISRLAVVKIKSVGDVLAVESPYSEQAVAMMRRVPGRRWDREKKVNTFPAASKASLWTVLKRCWPGALGSGPQGLFIIPQEVLS